MTKIIDHLSMCVSDNVTHADPTLTNPPSDKHPNSRHLHHSVHKTVPIYATATFSAFHSLIHVHSESMISGDRHNYLRPEPPPTHGHGPRQRPSPPKPNSETRAPCASPKGGPIQQIRPPNSLHPHSILPIKSHRRVHNLESSS